MNRDDNIHAKLIKSDMCYQTATVISVTMKILIKFEKNCHS